MELQHVVRFPGCNFYLFVPGVVSSSAWLSSCLQWQIWRGLNSQVLSWDRSALMCLHQWNVAVLTQLQHVESVCSRCCPCWWWQHNLCLVTHKVSCLHLLQPLHIQHPAPAVWLSLFIQLGNVFQQNLSFPNIHLGLPEFYETDLEMLNKILTCNAVWTSTKPPGQWGWEVTAFKINFF